MTNENCLYKEVCTNECSSSCIRLLEMNALLEQSNIPIARQVPTKLTVGEIDKQMFFHLATIKQNIKTFVDNGNNLFITSHTTGNGKTSWAIKLMLKYFDEIWAGNGFKCRGIFIHVPTLLSKLKDFNNLDEYYEQLKDKIPTVDLVIWDDIGASTLSAYDYSQLLTLLDQRINNNKSNIFTSNYLVTELDKILGAKLVSRVCNTSNFVEFKGGDKRGG